MPAGRLKDELLNLLPWPTPRNSPSNWLHASPPYFPDSLLEYRLKEGMVMNVASSPFPANGQWYDLSFRCEVDADATK